MDPTLRTRLKKAPAKAAPPSKPAPPNTPAQEGVVACRCGRADAGSLPAGELGGEDADAPGRVVDQDPLPGREAGVDEERLPGGERREGDRGGVDVVE